MPRRPGRQWASLTWELVSAEETFEGDVAVRLVTPTLKGGGRVVVRFGVRSVDMGDGTPAFDVLAPTAVTVEGPLGDHVSPETIASLRDVPLVAVIDSGRAAARDVLRRRAGGGIDELDAALARFDAVRHQGSGTEEFVAAFGDVLDVAGKSHPDRPLAFLASALGVGRSTVGRWASDVRAAREGGKEGGR